MTFLPSNTLQVPLDENVSFSIEPVKFNEQITRRYRDIAREVNVKERAFYPIESEIMSSQQWYNLANLQQYRSAFRRVYNFTTIATGATLVIAHGLTQMTMFTKIMGTVVTDVPDFRPVPYSSIVATTQIEVNVDDTNITIVNGATAPNVSSGMILLEYLKN